MHTVQLMLKSGLLVANQIRGFCNSYDLALYIFLEKYSFVSLMFNQS